MITLFIRRKVSKLCLIFKIFSQVLSNLISFFKKKNKRNKVIFVNETRLKPKGKIKFALYASQTYIHYIDIENFESQTERFLANNFSFNKLKIGCCFSTVKIEDDVVAQKTLIPKGQIAFIFSEEFNCYMLRVDLENYEKYFIRLWAEGEQSPCVSDESDESDNDSCCWL